MTPVPLDACFLISVVSVTEYDTLVPGSRSPDCRTLDG
jgi:hypothetical protein